RDRSDHGVAAIVVERIEQQFESPRLDGAGGLDLIAELAGEVDVEADGIAIGACIIERRIVELGPKANRLDAGQLRPLLPPAAAPKRPAPRPPTAAPRPPAPEGARRR